MGRQMEPAYDLAQITLQANNGSPRIQFVVAGTTGNVYRNWDVSSGTAAIDFNINDQTAIIYHKIAQEQLIH